MEQSSIGFEVQIEEAFDQAIDKVTSALKSEGFGILTRIDVHRTMKEKLGEDFRPYAILGACNPPLAFKALSAEPAVGLLLPCNVTVESNPLGGSLVRIVNPLSMLDLGQFDSAAVEEVAQQATERLRRVASSLGELISVE
jgi:uncharacterized protein (DUF302 family)